jgi:hypothetical protein
MAPRTTTPEPPSVDESTPAPAPGDRDPDDEKPQVMLPEGFAIVPEATIAAWNELVSFWGMNKRAPGRYTSQIDAAMERIARLLRPDEPPEGE